MRKLAFPVLAVLINTVVLGCCIMLAVSMPGCAAFKKLEPPGVEYVKADVLFEDVLGDRIAAWIADADDLTPTEKDALALALQAWRAMVARAADANDVPHGIEVGHAGP